MYDDQSMLVLINKKLWGEKNVHKTMSVEVTFYRKMDEYGIERMSIIRGERVTGNKKEQNKKKQM